MFCDHFSAFSNQNAGNVPRVPRVFPRSVRVALFRYCGSLPPPLLLAEALCNTKHTNNEGCKPPRLFDWIVEIVVPTPSRVAKLPPTQGIKLLEIVVFVFSASFIAGTDSP
jgi:hypothetical protein